MSSAVSRAQRNAYAGRALLTPHSESQLLGSPWLGSGCVRGRGKAAAPPYSAHSLSAPAGRLLPWGPLFPGVTANFPNFLSGQLPLFLQPGRLWGPSGARCGLKGGRGPGGTARGQQRPGTGSSLDWGTRRWASGLRRRLGLCPLPLFLWLSPVTRGRGLPGPPGCMA